MTDKEFFDRKMQVIRSKASRAGRKRVLSTLAFGLLWLFVVGWCVWEIHKTF